MNQQRDKRGRIVRRALILFVAVTLLALFIQVGLAQENVEPLAPTAGTLSVGVDTTPAGGEDFWVTAVSSQIAWGRPGTHNGLYIQPRDIAADSDGNLYVTSHKNHRIIKVTPNNQVIMRIGSPGSGNGQLLAPNQLVIAGDLIYLPDTGNHRVSVFETDGTFVRNWGQQGTGNGQFQLPQGIAIDDEGNIYISDTFNHRIQVFSPDGTYLRQWGNIGRRAGQFRYPTHLEFDDNDNLYVADSNNNRIQVFDKQGNFIRQMGYRGAGPGRFFIPVGLEISGGFLYVGDAFNDRIQKFTLDGQYVAHWSTGENGAALDRPNGILIEGGRLFVADIHSDLIQIFSETTFIVDDGQELSANLPSGTYDITQTPKTGWTLDDVTCTGASATDIANGVRVQLTDNITVSCAFANSQ